MIKTFRGLIASGGQDRIRLSTIKGKAGYKIRKFQIFPYNFNENDEYNVQIWKVSGQTATPHDFTNNSLLGAGYIETVSGAAEGLSPVVVFDNEIFNQDIYVTQSSQGGRACNYYIELEVIPLTDMGAEYSTLRDIRTAVTSTI